MCSTCSSGSNVATACSGWREGRVREGWFGLVEMSIFLGIPLAWGIWELVKLRREQARDRAREAEEPDAH